MGEQKLVNLAKTKPRQLQEAERQKQTPDVQNMLSPQHNPVTGVSCRCNTSDTLNRATLSPHSLLQLQRQYGNRYVQRVLALSRQGEGETDVAPEVEGAIEQKRGGGQTLDSKVRVQMESAFGVNFSGVRVHTDSEAHTLNQVLSARAFTTGQDIFFRQGEYNPGSSTGKELLAHELTHVVQQTGGVQTKLVVGEPGDVYEQEADRVAKAITGGIETECVRSSQPNPANLGKLHRRLETIRVPHWGSAPGRFSDSNVWFNPHAELWIGGRVTQSSWFPGSSSTSFTLSPGMQGTIRVVVNMGWFQDNAVFNYSGSAYSGTDVPFTVTAQGDLQLQQAIPSATSHGDAAELVTPVSVATGNSPTGGYIIVSPIIRSEGAVTATSGIDVGASSGVDVGGSFGAEETTSRTQAWQRSFTVNLIVPRPQTPTPQTIMYATQAHFAVRSDRVEIGTEEHIVRWYMSLPEDVKSSVRAGSTPIVLEGRASTTQPAPANRELSRRRAERVQQILRDIAGSQAQFQLSALGEYQARTADEVEELTERRVEISITIQRPGTNTPASANP